MKVIELRKDGHTAYVKKNQVVWMLSQGWDLVPTISLTKGYVRLKELKAKRCS